MCFAIFRCWRMCLAWEGMCFACFRRCSSMFHLGANNVFRYLPVLERMCFAWERMCFAWERMCFIRGMCFAVKRMCFAICRCWSECVSLFVGAGVNVFRSGNVFCCGANVFRFFLSCSECVSLGSECVSPFVGAGANVFCSGANAYSLRANVFRSGNVFRCEANVFRYLSVLERMCFAVERMCFAYCRCWSECVSLGECVSLWSECVSLFSFM